LLAAWLAALPLNVIGLIHGTMIARRRDAGERLHWYAHWYALVGVLLVFPALFFLVRTFLFQPFNLPTASMAPTLNKGDYFFARKFPYVRSNPQRGDMIVFNSYLGGRRVQYASRIVGLPGEHIRLIGGKLYINGSPPILKKLGGVQTYCDWGGCFSESEFMETVAGARPHRILQPTTDAPVDNTDAIAVPANSYFVLRDNRDISEDSWTSVRLVRANDIVGKVAIRYVDGRSQRWVWQTIE
jgi:signal peptidase I